MCTGISTDVLIPLKELYIWLYQVLSYSMLDLQSLLHARSFNCGMWMDLLP